MTKEEAKEKGYTVENYGGGFIICDYSGTRGEFGATYRGTEGVWNSQPLSMTPFQNEEDAWACAD